ncbi:general transcription factor 3C polypeptide 6-like isoform X2 [Strongylocentrotus purpuratus]|uniref:Transcription factor TFIIIC triple barrel domain-containing protein n=1 Tax=Strongylocentrotus purpuratus TaxID=7668 RepID=A0A7M7T4J7_STRPU|nr:general transcription factor 3C polypeptide 6-like isoform X2 [Strongylocentrotus purpuratus]
MAKSEASDGEWVEEEHLMLVELTGVLDYQYFAKSDKVCKLLGIGTENPVLQIGNYVFKGEYKKTVGTAVFFEQEKDDSKDWSYKCCTNKMLEMRRVFLQPKENVTGKAFDFRMYFTLCNFYLSKYNT